MRNREKIDQHYPTGIYRICNPRMLKYVSFWGIYGISQNRPYAMSQNQL